MTVMICNREQHSTRKSSQHSARFRVNQSVNNGGSIRTTPEGYAHLKEIAGDPVTQDYESLKAYLEAYDRKTTGLPFPDLDTAVYLKPVHHNDYGTYNVHGWIAMTEQELSVVLGSMVMTGMTSPVLRLAQYRITLFDALQKDEIEVVWVRPFVPARPRPTKEEMRARNAASKIE